MGRPPLPQSEWDARAAAANLKWLEPVRGSQDKSLAECLGCGKEWMVLPAPVSRGSGCRDCWIAGRALSQEEWNARAEKVGLEFLEPVVSAQSATMARCRTCDYEWAAIPNKVQQRNGCPRCAGKRLTQCDWNARAASIGLEWRGPVSTAQSKSPVRCLSCGHEWNVRPSSVARGYGCPECANRRKGQSQRLPHLVALPVRGEPG